MAMLDFMTPVGDATATPGSVDYRRKLASQMATHATDSSPKGSWLHILAQAMAGGMSGYESNGAQADEAAGRKTVADAFAGGKMPNAGAVAANPWMPASVLPHVLGAGDRAADRGIKERQLRIQEEDLGLRRSADARAGALSAAQLAQIQRATPEARIAMARDVLGILPTDPRYAPFIASGALGEPHKPPMTIIPAGAAAAVPDPTNPDGFRTIAGPPKPVDATTRRLVAKDQDELVNLHDSHRTLSRAMDLLPKVSTGFGEATMARIRAGTTNRLPTMTETGAADRARDAATIEFNQIMDLGAIEAMAAKLQGATTNFELQEFKRIMADPSLPVEIRKSTLQRMISKIEDHTSNLEDRIKENGGRLPAFLRRETAGPGAPRGGPAAPAPLSVTPGGTFVYNPATGGFEPAR